MPWLIDGDNLLGTWPGRKRDDRGRQQIAGELRRFASISKRRITIVFDGRPANRDGFGRNVQFPAPGESADDWILAHLRKLDETAGWTVVTSDRSLGDRCRWLGAKVVRSDRFRPRLAKIAPEHEKPDCEDDVDYWIEKFKEGPGPKDSDSDVN